jgi:hypothetical protein
MLTFWCIAGVGFLGSILTFLHTIDRGWEDWRAALAGTSVLLGGCALGLLIEGRGRDGDG